MFKRGSTSTKFLSKHSLIKHTCQRCDKLVTLEFTLSKKGDQTKIFQDLKWKRGFPSLEIIHKIFF